MRADRDASGSGVEVRVDDVLVVAQPGQRLIELCGAGTTGIQFGCRAGCCGTCLVRVVEGMENLSPVTGNEEILLPELTDDPSARLACQVRVLGPVRLKPAPLFG